MVSNALFEINTEDDEGKNIYLTFEIAGETYAVNIGYVTTIVGMQRISSIPDVPAYIKGAMNLRGKVIPVMDLRLRFNLPWRDYDDRTSIIVLDLGENSTGLVVETVSDVVTIPPEKMGPPPRSYGSGEKGAIMGLGRMDDRIIIVLDVNSLLLEREVTLDLQGVKSIV